MSMVLERKGVENTNNLDYKRLGIFMADLGDSEGSVQGGYRPVMIVSNDKGNKFSPCVVVVAITAQLSKAKLPTHVMIKKEDCAIERDSVILCEQFFTLNKTALSECLFQMPDKYRNTISRALQISIEL
jgi:mRNA interferase MazF